MCDTTSHQISTILCRWTHVIDGSQTSEIEPPFAILIKTKGARVWCEVLPHLMFMLCRLLLDVCVLHVCVI